MKVCKFVGALLLALGILLSSVAIANASASHKTITVTWHRPKLDPKFPQYLGTHPLSKTAICQVDVYYQDTKKQRAIWQKLRSGKVLRIVGGKPADSAIYKSSTVGPCTPVILPTTTRSTPSTPASSVSTTAPPSKSTTPAATQPSSSPTTTPSATSRSGIAPPQTTSRSKPRTSTHGVSVTTMRSTTVRAARKSANSALPNTGAPVWSLAGVAVLLLAVGATLWYVGRKRGTHI